MDGSEILPTRLAQVESRPVDPEELELLGKRAAALYEKEGIPLSEAVVHVVKDSGLSPEQVKRVCEFANTAAFLSAFDQAGEVRNVTFEGGPANPAKVLQDLNDGSSTIVRRVRRNDYAPPAERSFKEKRKEGGDDVLKQAFGHNKISSVDHTSHANPIDDVYDLNSDLKGVEDYLKDKLAEAQSLLDDAKRELCEAVKQEVLDGSSVADIATAWGHYTDDPGILKEAVSMACKYLRDHGVMDREGLVESMSKYAAGSVPNPSHPVVRRYIAFTKLASISRRLETAHSITSDRIGEINSFLKGVLNEAQ